MQLMSLRALKLKRLNNSKRNRATVQSKQLEYRLEMELVDKLNDKLEDNDRVMIEVNKRVLGEFLNILDKKAKLSYDYEQVDSNKFVFYNKEIIF